jgi:hypothetical protein
MLQGAAGDERQPTPATWWPGSTEVVDFGQRDQASKKHPKEGRRSRLRRAGTPGSSSINDTDLAISQYVNFKAN